MVILLIICLWLISLSMRITITGINSLAKVTQRKVNNEVEDKETKKAVNSTANLVKNTSTRVLKVAKLLVDVLKNALTALLPAILVMDLIVFLLLTTIAGSFLLLFKDDANASTSTGGGTTSISTGVDSNSNTSNSLKDDFKAINQNPELPTGCEVTSLTMVLNHLGLDISKKDMCDYLDKGAVGDTDPKEKFVGDPTNSSSYGCYSPVIVKAANKYLESKSSEYKAKDISGKKLDDLFSYIDDDKPVMVWGTVDCKEGSYTVSWTINGKTVKWYAPEHCMVLVGHDDNNVWVADPMHGDVRSYKKTTFSDRYDKLGKQAVIIEK